MSEFFFEWIFRIVSLLSAFALFFALGLVLMFALVNGHYWLIGLIIFVILILASIPLDDGIR